MTPSRPLYRAVLDGLRDDLRKGTFRAGAALPSERDLERRFGVSRITVRRAMDALAQEGLIQRSAGRVARVAAPRLVQALASFEDASSGLRLVRDTRVEVLGFAWQTADDALARGLLIREGDQVLRVTRLRHQEDVPVFHSVTFLPAAVGALLDRAAVEAGPLQEALAAAGLVGASTEREMRAAPCPREVAARLGLRAGTPTLRTARLTRDEGGRPLHLLTGYWRWDRFAMRLVSGGSGTGHHLTVFELRDTGEELAR